MTQSFSWSTLEDDKKGYMVKETNKASSAEFRFGRVVFVTKPILLDVTKTIFGLRLQPKKRHWFITK